MGLEWTYREYVRGAVCVPKPRSNSVLPEPATGAMLVMASWPLALSKVRLSAVKLDGTTRSEEGRGGEASVFGPILCFAMTTTSQMAGGCSGVVNAWSVH